MNQPYDKTRYQFVTGAFTWTAIDLVLAALSGTPDFVPGDTQIASIVGRGGVVLGYSQPILNKTVVPDGTVQTGPVVIPTVPVGPDITWFVLAKRFITPNLSEPIYFIDDAYTLPFTPNGLDVIVQPDWLQQRGWFRG